MSTERSGSNDNTRPCHVCGLTKSCAWREDAWVCTRCGAEFAPIPTRYRVIIEFTADAIDAGTEPFTDMILAAYVQIEDAEGLEVTNGEMRVEIVTTL